MKAGCGRHSGRSWAVGTEAEAMEEHCLLAHLVCLLIQARTVCPAVVRPRVGWTSWTCHSSRKGPTDLPVGLVDPSVAFLFPDDCSSCQADRKPNEHSQER